MEIKLKKFKSIFIILLYGELDLYNAPKLDRLYQNIQKRGAATCIIDLNDVSYIDSSGVGILLKLRSLASDLDIDLLLSGVEGEVLGVLKLTNLIQFFTLASDYKSGIKKLLKESTTENGKSIND